MGFIREKSRQLKNRTEDSRLGDAAMNSDLVGVFLLVGSAAALSLWIRHCMKIGRWRYRGGVVFRNNNPRLFLGIVMFACAYVVMMVLILLLALDHDVVCGGRGTPRACLANQLHALGN